MSFVTELDVALAPKMKSDLVGQGFELARPPYTLFAAKKPGISCTFYESGKLVVQGKNSQEFIEFYLEPEILGTFEFSHPTVDDQPRIGTDEAGKGDFFGALCISGVYADEAAIAELIKLGVADSKKLTDPVMVKMSEKIGQLCTVESIVLRPAKYNELYAKFNNLNTLLGWAHGTIITNLVEKTGARHAIVDKFADDRVVQRFVKADGLDLVQRVRAEADVVVAAASIVARSNFVKNIDHLSNTFGMTIPKGASAQVVRAGRAFVAKYGEKQLREVAKLHFKTRSQVI